MDENKKKQANKLSRASSSIEGASGEKTKAQECTEYREKKKSEKHRAKEAERLRHYRATISDEKRKKSNEAAKLRMRRMKERKLAAQGITASTCRQRPTTRTAAEKEKERKAYKARKQREYRANLSGNKNRAIRKKDADAHRARYLEKVRAQSVTKAKPKSKTPTIAEVLPDSPSHFAATVENIIESATPTINKPF